MAIARAGRHDRFGGGEPLSATLQELMASTQAELVSVHVLDASGAPQEIARLQTSGVDRGRERGPRGIPDLVDRESLDGLLTRATVFVRSGDGENVPVMFSPITVG
ncbi:MAG TPA: hypothetical protein VFT74_21330, partial [Isosphaeraceae bacterium]|nr:hypothetical protein [Isosphaeraceae bacterium]